MNGILRAIIGALGLFYAAIGVAILAVPARIGAEFFLEPVTIQGVATLRADFAAFFLTGGLFAAYAALKNRAAHLLAPLMLIGLAFSGR